MKDRWPVQFPGINWLGEEEEAAVLDVLRRGTLFRYDGPETPTQVQRLEQLARETYGVRHALAVSSGTGALFTAMSALGIGPGCEVIIPTFMWVATVGAVVHCNAIPVLCEVDDSFNLDPEDLERRITKRTRLIVAVHMAGTPCDMGRIMEVADRHGIPVLEDCAQCNGGTFGGQMVGTFGKVGIFSLQMNKNVTAGEGGLIITNDDELYPRLIGAHDVGTSWKGGQPDESDPVQLWGQGRRLSELGGAVANVQLRKLSTVVNHMRSSKERIKAALSGLRSVSFRRLNDAAGDTGPFLILVFEDTHAAERGIKGLQKAGVRHVIGLSDYGLHIYSNIRALTRKVPLSPAGNPWALSENANSVYEYGKGACPVSDDLFSRSAIVTIPSRLSQEQEEQMAESMRSVLKSL
ncbi:MAG: DegT/DnrJ/EryC1/StrS family aminotransferase [Acidobacteriota bacterium]|nr:MAG: DegT/DnrJ/EryC1/StrS family aminotransferase [Acidobacteriota bacterium]